MAPRLQSSSDRRSCFDDPEMLAAARILVAMMSDPNGINVDRRRATPLKPPHTTVTVPPHNASEHDAYLTKAMLLNSGASNEASAAARNFEFRHFDPTRGAGPPPPLSPASDETLRPTTAGKPTTPTLTSNVKPRYPSPSKLAIDPSSDKAELVSFFACSSCLAGTVRFTTTEELEKHWAQFHRTPKQPKARQPRETYVAPPTWRYPKPPPHALPRFICHSCIPRISFPFESDLAIHKARKHGAPLPPSGPSNRPVSVSRPLGPPAPPAPPKATIFFCPFCPESKVSFDTEQGLEGHWARHPDHALTDFSCAVANCRRAFLSEKNLHRHMVEVHG